MKELRKRAINLLDYSVRGYVENPSEKDKSWRQADCHSQILFAGSLGLITNLEVANYLQKINLETFAESYKRLAAILGETK